MAAGSRDRLPMLTAGRYPQWRSRFLWYIDTRQNCEALRKCILSDPYKPTTVLVQAVDATDDSPAVPEHTTVETPMNMSPENKAHFLAEKEAIHLILIGIRDEIYSTVDACQTAQEMWEAIERLQQAIERLQQGESLNIQDVKTNLFWQFRKFTSHDGESMESYYTRFYKPMNEMIRNNLTVTTMQVNVQFLQQLQPEWSRGQPSLTSSKGQGYAKEFGSHWKVFKKIYKPTNNNFRTSSNSKNKNVDTTLQYKNDDHSGQFRNHRTKAKRVKDFAYQKEKMLLCKQAEQGVPFQEVPTADSGIDSEPVEQVQDNDGYNVFTNDLQHFEQSESVSNTCLVEMDDSIVIPDAPDICEDDIQNEQNDIESDDERVVLADLIANLKLDVDENKKIQKQLKKANTTLAQELKECKAILAETSKSLGESISVRDSCMVALQTKQTEFEKYKAFNDRTVDYDKLERKLNEALGELAHKDTVIREGLKTKAYELLVVKENNDELMKHSLLTKSHYEGLVKQKMKVITDLKLREELIPDREETLALKRENRSKLNKDLIHPYDYTTLNSLYEIFKPPTQEYETQLAYTNEIRRHMWRTSFVKSKPNIYKNVGFLPVSKSISKS
nr:hypothetical protein [Tanacetum cinerariifolium]